MIPYEEFEQLIRDESGESFMQWKHLVPAVPIFYRSRFLLGLRSGFSITRSFDMVVTNIRMTDDDFCLFVEQMIAIEKPYLNNDTIVINN